jgi:multidrug transporter EmrE-like cation transporter
MGYFLVAMTVLLTVFGQFAVKWQVLRAGPLPADLAARAGFMLKLLMNPWIVAGLGAAFAASLCWMLAMTKLPLSQAYPYTAASFVLVVLGGAWLFSEPLTPSRIAGVVLIGIGVILTGLQ